jgi:hypothetical protein
MLIFAWWDEFIDLLKIDDVLYLDLYLVFEYAGFPESVNIALVDVVTFAA